MVRLFIIKKGNKYLNCTNMLDGDNGFDDEFNSDTYIAHYHHEAELTILLGKLKDVSIHSIVAYEEGVANE